MEESLVVGRTAQWPAPSLTRLLKPRSVAIVGASDKPGSLGASVLTNLERAGFGGEIHLINPKRATIGARPCVASVADLPHGVDAAILAIPQSGVLDAVRALATQDVGAAVIFSAGFAEGGEQGAAEQAEIGRIAAQAGMVVEGPNCLGLVNFIDNVPLTFIELPHARATGDHRVGIVSQSGAMAAVLATTMIARGVPLSCYISTGNEAASGVEDYVDYLVDDPATQVIGMIVEHFRKPRRFLDVATQARAAGKTIVLLHPGRSEAGRESAATHTGAMAGDHAVMRALVERAGVICVDGLEELGDVVELALRCAVLPGPDVAVIAESGALKAMMLDAAEALDVTLPVFCDADSPALRAALPPFVLVTNPLDVTAQGLVDPGLYTRTLNALFDDARVRTILVMLIQTDVHTAHIKFAAVADAIAARATDKPVIVVGVDEGGRVASEDIDRLHALGVAYLPTPERAMRALARLSTHAARPAGVDPAAPVALDLVEATGTVIPEYRSKALLTPHGVPFSEGRMARTLDEARAVAAALGYPVALKAQAADLGHKSDAGGVILALADEAALAAGWTRLHANLAAARPGLVLEGVLVERMAAKGQELIVGARVDPACGPVILIGFGGVAAELLRDVVILPPDLDHAAIVAALLGLRMAPLLTGFRGAPALDVDAVADIVVVLGRIVRGTPGIREVDLNPVMVYPEGALALDALISC